MSLSETCIRRPVMTTLLMLSFVVFGIFGYRQLPVSALPRVDFPTVSVSASLPLGVGMMQLTRPAWSHTCTPRRVATWRTWTH